jgi:hypothetical protein
MAKIQAYCPANICASIGRWDAVGWSARKKAQRRSALRHGRSNIVIRPIQYSGALQKSLVMKLEFNVNKASYPYFRI